MRIIDTNRFAIRTHAVEHGRNLLCRRLIVAQILFGTVTACTLFVAGTRFAIGLLLNVTDIGITMPRQALNIHGAGLAIDLARLAFIGLIAIFAYAILVLRASFAIGLECDTNPLIAIVALALRIGSARFAIGLWFV